MMLAGLRSRVRDLDCVLQSLTDRQRATRQPAGERLAFEQLHHQELDVTAVN
jgi:hypothetical protein